MSLAIRIDDQGEGKKKRERINNLSADRLHSHSSTTEGWLARHGIPPPPNSSVRFPSGPVQKLVCSFSYSPSVSAGSHT